MLNIDTPCRPIACPKCGLEPAYLIERWRGNTIEFDYSHSARSSEGVKRDEGEPCGVQAVCDCGHKWTLRNVTQITELDEPSTPEAPDGK